MNQQVEKLIEQAEAYANEQNELYGVSFKQTYNSKFAELIVRECAIIVDKATGRRGSNTVGELLKQHFGVEQ
jgi:hypothetical protein